MSWCLKCKFPFSYGVTGIRGKALAILLALAMPALAWAEEVTILAFGDSLTQGYGLPQGEGFVPRLEAWLRAEGQQVRVINGGVSGDTTAGGAARVEWSLTPEIDAMIVTLGGNDLLRGIEPAVTRANLTAILEVARARGVAVLLVGMRAPGNYGAEYSQAFDRIYPELAEAFGTLYFDNFFKGLGEDDPNLVRTFLQADGLHPNAEGVKRIVAAIGPAVLDLIRAVKPGS